MEAGDILTETEAKYVNTLEGIRDVVRAIVEGGNLIVGDGVGAIDADQYNRLVKLMVKATALEASVWEEEQEENES